MKNNGIAAIVMVLCIAILGACFSDWDGGRGSIKIPDSDDAELAALKADPTTTYTVILKRNGQEYGSYGPLSYAAFMAFEVPPGNWDIDLWVEDATDWAKAMKWTGSNVKVGAMNVATMSNAKPSFLDKFEREFERIKDDPGSKIDVGIPIEVSRDISLKGISKENPPKITMTVKGSLFKVTAGTLRLENITLNGNDTNTAPLVEVSGNGAKLIMGAGSTITGNKNTTTDDGEALHGGGVRVTQGGTFTMTDGAIITKNNAKDGAGVKVNYGATFTMEEGAIITDNTATRSAGGVHISEANFTMNGGEISNNSAGFHGGGVYFGGTPGKVLRLTIGIGGKVYGTDGGAKANSVGGTEARKGVAIYASDGYPATTPPEVIRTRDTTVQNETLSLDGKTPTGTWTSS